MADAKRYPVVEVEWTDASYEDDVMDPAALSQLVQLRTVGFLVMETREAVSVAMEVCDKDATCRHVSHIPKVNIIKLRRVRR